MQVLEILLSLLNSFFVFVSDYEKEIALLRAQLAMSRAPEAQVPLHHPHVGPPNDTQQETTAGGARQPQFSENESYNYKYLRKQQEALEEYQAQLIKKLQVGCLCLRYGSRILASVHDHLVCFEVFSYVLVPTSSLHV